MLIKHTQMKFYYKVKHLKVCSFVSGSIAIHLNDFWNDFWMLTFAFIHREPKL